MKNASFRDVKDKAMDMGKDMANKAEKTYENVRDSKMGETIREKVEDVKGTSFSDIKDKAMDMAGNAYDKVKDTKVA